jgi:hypothetical protein
MSGYVPIAAAFLTSCVNLALAYIVSQQRKADAQARLSEQATSTEAQLTADGRRIEEHFDRLDADVLGVRTRLHDISSRELQVLTGDVARLVARVDMLVSEAARLERRIEANEVRIDHVVRRGGPSQ